MLRRGVRLQRVHRCRRVTTVSKNKKRPERYPLGPLPYVVVRLLCGGCLGLLQLGLEAESLASLFVVEVEEIAIVVCCDLAVE